MSNTIYIPAPNPNPPSYKVRSLLLQASLLEHRIADYDAQVRLCRTYYLLWADDNREQSAERSRRVGACDGTCDQAGLLIIERS